MESISFFQGGGVGNVLKCHLSITLYYLRDYGPQTANLAVMPDEASLLCCIPIDAKGEYSSERSRQEGLLKQKGQKKKKRKFPYFCIMGSTAY